MQTASTKPELCAVTNDWKNQHQRIAFVPTMGALHEGHLSLIDIARKNADKIVVSIFVNPKQFAPHEDFDTYPRNIESDLDALQKCGVDLAYLPEHEAIYPNDFATHFTIKGPNIGLDSDHRPHFFNGVAIVVCKLFNQIRPDVAVFGEKDYQQLMVICQMVKDLDMNIKIIGAPLVRDENGLALSSRNAYLSEEEYKIACKLNVILRDTALAIKDNAADVEQILALARQEILGAGFHQLDYLELRWSRLLTAAWVGKTRLLDNVATLSDGSSKSSSACLQVLF